MKHLYELSRLSDSEFLSFLYAERDRQDTKSGAPGWSLWALIGSAFALVLYIYTSAKEVESVDFLLCYYVFSVFCPIVLYVIFVIEQIRMFSFGDSKHVECLKNVAPTVLLSSLMGVYGTMAVIGFVLEASTESVIRCAVVLIPIVASLITIAIERNSLVTTLFSFRVSALDWWNRVLMGLMGGAMLCPLYGGIKHLAFGFSYEFEVTFAFVILIAIVYIFIQNKVNGSRVADIDMLIDGYLYRDWKKECIVRELELMRLGKTPFMELEREYNRVIDASGLIEESKRRAKEISLKIQEQGLSANDLDKLLKEIDDMTKAISAVLDSQKDFHEKAKILIQLKSTLGDSEFRAMLDTTYDLAFVRKIFGDCENLMDMVNENIVPQIHSYIEEIKEEVCLCEDCPHRLVTDSNCDS